MKQRITLEDPALLTEEQKARLREWWRPQAAHWPDKREIIGNMSNTSAYSNAPPLILAPEERRLIEYLRELKWGTTTVEIKNGVPVMAHTAVKDVKLTEDEKRETQKEAAYV